MIKLILIPLGLMLFVMAYPFVEYNIDCPSAMYDLSGNESCTHTKHMLWVVVANLSLTEYGFPSDCEAIQPCWWAAENNPDAYDSVSMVPMAFVAGVMICLAKVREHEKGKRQKLRELR